MKHNPMVGLSLVIMLAIGSAAAGYWLGHQSSALAHQLELAGPVTAQAGMGTAFSYQGQLKDGGNPANGTYDFEFKLYSDPVADSQVGPTVPTGDVTVTNGLFTVLLDFGSGVFNGEARHIAIGVRPGSSTGAYTPLSPRQPIAPVPYALYSGNGGVEHWRLGIVAWGDAPSEQWDILVSGLTASAASGGFGPNDCFPPFDCFYTFPLAAQSKTVQSAELRVASFSEGAPFSEPINVALEIWHRPSGSQPWTKRVVSNTVDVTSPATQGWVVMSLSANASDLVIAPNTDLLSFHIVNGSPALPTGASIDLRFEVLVR